MTLFTLNIDFVLQICATGFEATSKLMTAILEIKKFNFYAICNSLAYFFFIIYYMLGLIHAFRHSDLPIILLYVSYETIFYMIFFLLTVFGQYK